jgi:6-phosphogluconolactonase (cycloisomerase 2 family)
VVDHLASQGSLAYDREHGLLYAVNAGSNTITVFSVYGDRLVRRQVISSGGTFPVSIAFHGGLLYVLNARDGGSVHVHHQPERDADAGRPGGDGQAATCWIARDGSLLYASNAGSATLSGYGDDGSGTLQPLGTTATNTGTVDATSSADGQYLYAETGANGIVDEFRVGSGGSLTEIGSVTVPGAVGAEGIAAS